MEDILKFLQDRLKGATKIATEAAAKSGTAELTAWHFRAKLPEYRHLIRMVKEKGPVKGYCQQRFKYLTSKLKSKKVGQKEYQQLTGQLEVYGEVLNAL